MTFFKDILQIFTMPRDHLVLASVSRMTVVLKALGLSSNLEVLPAGYRLAKWCA
jgi:hypothetical protein